MRRVTGELAELAALAVEEAQRLLANAKRALRRARAEADELRQRGVRDAAAGRRRGRLARAVDELTELLEATRKVVAQSRQRIAGHPPLAPPDGSACTTAMPVRSPRAASGAPSNSGTRRRSSTTTTGSFWITLWSGAIRPTRRHWLLR